MLRLQWNQINQLDLQAEAHFEDALRARYSRSEFPEDIDLEGMLHFCKEIGLSWESHIIALFDFVTGRRFAIEALEMFPIRMSDEDESDHLIRVELFLDEYRDLMI